MTDIQGACPILTTPFDDDRRVDESSLRNIVQTHVEGECSALVLFGLASEFYKLTDAERDRIATATIDECADTDTAVIYSVTDHATNVAVDRAITAEEAGADVLMILPPHFLDPSAADVVSHVERVSQAVSIPVMVQYAPGPTGLTLLPETLAALSDRISNIQYYKIESRPPGPYSEQLFEAATEEVDVFVGNAGYQMIDALDRGAVGVMPGSPLIDVYIDIYDRYVNGNRDEALAIHDELMPILNHITQTPEMAFHYGKQILYRRGLIASPMTRTPSYTPDEQDDRLFERHYAAIEPYLESPSQG